jgi:hypothetical protein
VSEITTFLVITGTHTSTKTVLDYVEHIVYGAPRIEAVLVGSHFVALLEYLPSEETAARYTSERMGSFPHGVRTYHDLDDALRAFGDWVRHWAPSRNYLASLDSAS